MAAIVVLIVVGVLAPIAYFRVDDATKSLVAIENVAAAINQIDQTMLRKVVGQHTLDEAWWRSVPTRTPPLCSRPR